MCIQTATCGECLFTFGAGKWLLTRVCPFMSLQITLLVKTLVTFGAGKWLLLCGPFYAFLDCWLIVRASAVLYFDF